MEENTVKVKVYPINDCIISEELEETIKFKQVGKIQVVIACTLSGDRVCDFNSYYKLTNLLKKDRISKLSDYQYTYQAGDVLYGFILGV